MAEPKARAGVPAHPVPQVAERRRRLLLCINDQDAADTTQSSSEDSASQLYLAYSPIIKLSAEGRAKLLEVGQALDCFLGAPHSVCRKLSVVICAELLSKDELYIEDNVFHNRELRRILLESYSTTSTVPVPTTLEGLDREQLGTYLSCFALFKAPSSSLDDQLQVIKQAAAMACIQYERERIAAAKLELAEIKAELNKLLTSNGEPEFPFEDIFVDAGATAHTMSLTCNFEGRLDSLEQRKPELYKEMLEHFTRFGAKAVEIKKDYFKKGPPEQAKLAST